MTSQNLKHWVIEDGMRLFSLKKLEKTRKVIQFDELDLNDRIEDQITKRISEHINLNIYNVSIIKKVTYNGYSHRNHKDGYNARESRTDDGQKYYKWISIPTCFGEKSPAFSCIYYMSDHGSDFNGGILEFVDGMKVIPKKNLCVIFDSDTVHKVWQQTGVGNIANQSRREFYLILLRPI